MVSGRQRPKSKVVKSQQFAGHELWARTLERQYWTFSAAGMAPWGSSENKKKVVGRAATSKAKPVNVWLASFFSIYSFTGQGTCWRGRLRSRSGVQTCQEPWEEQSQCCQCVREHFDVEYALSEKTNITCSMVLEKMVFWGTALGSLTRRLSWPKWSKAELGAESSNPQS